jgi:GNAT superfamily N-acetyltransferase
VERKWAAREYQPGDERGIIALWTAAFPDGERGRADLQYWHWQFCDPPAGSARIRVAVVDGTVVGHYAVIPVPMQIKGEAILGTLSLDTMTHPDYQRQGILTTLASELYAELGRDGFPLTYGFPNENSVGALVNKLRWAYVCSLPVYVKPLRAGAVIERILPNRLLAAALRPFARLGLALVCRPTAVANQARRSIRRLEQFDTRADELWQIACDRQKIALTRSAAHLNWRYFRNPLREYRVVAYEEREQLVAYAVVRSMEQFGLRGGMILELIGRPGREDALQAVLAAAEEHSRREGMDLMACLLHGDGRVTRLLKRNGFLLAPKRSFKEWYFCVRVNNDSVDSNWSADPDSWYVTFGDTDII